MIDQSLRDAIAVALHDKECSVRNCEPTTMGPYYDEADKILAAHPAEPAPVVTDEAVEAAEHRCTTCGGMLRWHEGKGVWQSENFFGWTDQCPRSSDRYHHPESLPDGEGPVSDTRPERTDARPGWLQKMARDVNAAQATAQQLASEVVDLSHAYPVPVSLAEVCAAYDRREPAASLRSEAEVKAEALREAADTVKWAKVMSPYRALRERADDLEAAAPLLGPRPLLDRDAVSEALLAKWLVLSEQKVEASPVEHSRSLAGAVMELARQMPTADEFAGVLLDYTDSLALANDAADAVVAWLNEAES